MVSSIKLILPLTIMAILVCTGYAIKCYQCDSLDNPNCATRYKADDSMVVDCSKLTLPSFLPSFFTFPNATGCEKTTIEFLPGELTIFRNCYFRNVSILPEVCEDNPRRTCEFCTVDLCN
ncbi:uncharacterized protein LOC108141642 [Drosophila elegans]|uniref:uncharacterized protein LOC108141642 n=1 Tax=Drosophila elegans TaxID=30023 RepID=UPI0007E7B287|nr:uncharacterized protein LOC108141642 [Drosophila elegans]